MLYGFCSRFYLFKNGCININNCTSFLVMWRCFFLLSDGFKSFFFVFGMVFLICLLLVECGGNDIVYFLRLD